MPTKITLLKEMRDQIIADLLKQAEGDAKAYAKQVEAFLKKQFERTFAHWNESGRNKFPPPEVEFKTYVRASQKGIQIIINAVVVAPGGQVHRLWHWLAFGTKDIVAQKTLGPFPIRKANRTKVRDLDADPFPGFTGEWRSIGKGKVRKGIEARQWYEAVVDELKKFVDKTGNSTLVAYALENTDIRKP